MTTEGGKERAVSIGLGEATERVRCHVGTLGVESLPLETTLHRVVSGDVRARVSSPTDDVSLKDGFALPAGETQGATEAEPAVFRIIGSRFAGGLEDLKIQPGEAVGVTSGAVLPMGADAVVGSEYCREEGGEVRVSAPVSPGRNVLAHGTDIREGEVLLREGEILTPGRVGLLAAAGIEQANVFKAPRVALVATGDEVVAPGRPLGPGQLYASNLCTLASWLQSFGIPSTCRVLPDNREEIRQGLQAAMKGAHVLMTSGGAWGSERDLVISVLEELGWKKVFHRVRLGPGKAVGFGLLGEKPVFCLPGGPPSNEMAFLQLALPGTLLLAGWQKDPFPTLEARLSSPVKGRETDWTQMMRAKLYQDRDGIFWATPYKPASRLESMASAQCLIPIREGTERLEKGARVRVQLLIPPGGINTFTDG